MILKALCDYYNRCGNLAPSGMEYKEIAFVIVINADGDFVRLEDCRIDTKRAKLFCVCKGVSKTSAPIANAMWENVEYTLGYSKECVANEDEDIEKVSKARAKAAKNNQVMIAKCQELHDKFPFNKAFEAVCKFYANHQVEQVKESPLWHEIEKKPTVNLSFRLDGQVRIIAEDDDLNRGAESLSDDHLATTVCLVSGLKCTPKIITSATPVPGSQSTAKLVAFQVNSGYDSYGKSQALNAPISSEAEFAYTTALKNLLSKDSRNKFSLGSRTFLFWASSDSEVAQQAESLVYDFFGFSAPNTDDPNRRIEWVRKVFDSLYSGVLHSDANDKFYILGLAPNAARIATVYWNEIPLRDFAYNMRRHFDDMEMVDTRKNQKPYFGIHSIMGAVTLGGKSSAVQPNLPEATMKSIFQNTPYPYSLYTACLNRIRAEQEVGLTRAAIIKAYINRLNNNSKLTPMIDKQNTNQGYLCGRLFATLEYIQERSNNNTNTIRGRYLNSASTTPAVVFSTLLNLSAHHSDKLDRGVQIYFENLKSEIMDKISADGFPPHLDLQDQGRFMVGYYHQRQEFFTAKTKEPETQNAEQ